MSKDRLAIAFQNRGTAYIAKGDPDRAIPDYDRAIGLDPNYANAFNGRGVAYQAKGDNERATAMSRMDLDQQTTEANLKFFSFVRSGSPN